MSRVIVFGASGQLGQCLEAVSSEQKISGISFLPKGDANILDTAKLRKIFSEHSPQYCINCAAYTAVDKAEDEKETAEKLNVEGVANLSKLCQEYGATLIHISTDFVFDGGGNVPLREEDQVGPINVYGATKLAGEQIIPTFLNNYFIIRTSWLYSEFGSNFVKTMLRLGEERDELKVIWDQIGTPTYAVDLARCIIEIIETGNRHYGLYHYSNEGVTSWYDFAKAIFELSNLKVKVLPVRTSEYITKALRPSFSVMDKTKIKENLNLTVPHWQESLEACLNRL